MRSTHDPRHRVPPFLGVDLTDRYSRACRPIDVCGLQPAGDRLQASFWTWHWDPAPAPLDIRPVLGEVRAARCVLVDGPQALAARGMTLRTSERLTAAAGKTPDHRPMAGPFAGFIRSSLDLFAALDEQGVPVSSDAFGHGVGECYPGHAWTVTAGRRLPKKTTPAGLGARRVLLEICDVDLGDARLNHDQLDAGIGALLAAATCGVVPDLTTARLGVALARDPDSTLREGPIIAPACVRPALRDRIAAALDADG